MNGRQMIEDLTSRGYDCGEIDETAVQRFVSPAGELTTAQLAVTTDRLEAMIGRREMAKGVNLATMAAALDRLMALWILRPDAKLV